MSDFRAVTPGKGLFVAAGANNSIAWSSNGVQWTVHNVGGVNSFMGVAYGNGVFVAATLQGRVFISTTGDTWGGGAPLPAGTFAEHVAFGGGLFTIAGGEYLLASFSGAAWSPRRLPVPDALFSSGYGDGVILAAGEDGVILQSADIRPRLTVTPLADGSGMEITARGGVAANYRLQSASRPSASMWSDLELLRHDGVESRWVDSELGGDDGEARYYRLR